MIHYCRPHKVEVGSLNESSVKMTKELELSIEIMQVFAVSAKMSSFIYLFILQTLLFVKFICIIS